MQEAILDITPGITVSTFDHLEWNGGASSSPTAVDRSVETLISRDTPYGYSAPLFGTCRGLCWFGRPEHDCHE